MVLLGNCNIRRVANKTKDVSENSRDGFRVCKPCQTEFKLRIFG